jgi:hypothetical protein
MISPGQIHSDVKILRNNPLEKVSDFRVFNGSAG